MFDRKFAGRPSPVRLMVIPLVAALLLLPVASVRADVTPTSPPDESAILRQARELLQKAGKDPAAARTSGRPTRARRRSGAAQRRGPAAARRGVVSISRRRFGYRKELPFFEKAGHYAELALKIDPQQWAGHYWLGLSELRETQKVGGLRAYLITRRVIDELEKVSNNRPGYNFGGPPRVLCHLYRAAPTWTPFGDIDKSIAYGKQAVRVAPGHALNHFYLAQAYLRANDKAAAVAQLRNVLELQPNPLVEEARRKLKSLGETGQ